MLDNIPPSRQDSECYIRGTRISVSILLDGASTIEIYSIYITYYRNEYSMV